MQSSESTALTERREGNGELQTAASEAAVQQEIQGALILAKRFPRDEDLSYQAITRSCKRLAFADAAQYSFPRGGNKITGPSIYFAREFARVWGNIRHGYHVIHDDLESRTIRAWSWDLETNTKVEADDTFRKEVQRKQHGQTVWVAADERDLRELTNRRAAIAKRNCILELLPADLVEDAINVCEATLKEGVEKDPDATRKALLQKFGELNVKATDLKTYLGGPLDQASPAQLSDLRKMYKSIKDGAASWGDFLPQQQAEGLPVGRQGRKPKGEADPRPALLALVRERVQQLEWAADQVSGFCAEFGDTDPARLTAEQLQALVGGLDQAVASGRREREPGEEG